MKSKMVRQLPKLKGDRCKVSHERNGQYRVTIPKRLAERAGLSKGSVVSITLADYGDIRMMPVKEDE